MMKRDDDPKPTGVYGLELSAIEDLRKKGGLCHRAFFNFGLQVVSPVNPTQGEFRVQNGAAPCCGPDGLCHLWDRLNQCCLERTKLVHDIALLKLQTTATVTEKAAPTKGGSGG